FGFFFPGDRDRGRRIEWTPGELEVGRAILDKVCRTIGSGAFLSTDNWKDDCTFCDYRRICGDVKAVAAASRLKLDNPQNVLLQPFLELRPPGEEHEDDAEE